MRDEIGRESDSDLSEHFHFLPTPLRRSSPDIVMLNTGQLIYDHFVDKKPCNFTLASVSEQHNYDTRSASLQHLNPSSFRINLRKFCPTVIGCYYWNDIPLSTREKKN